MRDIRQSEMYAKYMQRTGWVVVNADGTRIFIKRLPLIGSFIKIQRPDRIPSMGLIEGLVRKYRAWRVSLEMINDEGLMINELDEFKINKNPYLPTKTIQIDLIPREDEIFNRFTEAKRRAVRRAIKNRIVLKESDNIEEFIKLKSKDFWPMSFFMARDLRALWESFAPANGAVLIASKVHPRGVLAGANHLGGVLLLFNDNVAYYWMAASSEEGKKLFAPTLLVWEALKLAKKKKCKIFDFEGIYDERFHNATKKWKGFTKFKQGFGGEEVTFPKPLIRHYRAF